MERIIITQVDINENLRKHNNLLYQKVKASYIEADILLVEYEEDDIKVLVQKVRKEKTIPDKYGNYTVAYYHNPEFKLYPDGTIVLNNNLLIHHFTEYRGTTPTRNYNDYDDEYYDEDYSEDDIIPLEDIVEDIFVI